MIPVIISIAGSDCSAGAGLQADLKAGLAMGAFPLTVLTCAVSEIPGLVESIVPMTPDFVAGQLRLCLKNYPIAAMKAGMLYSAGIVRAVSEVLEECSYDKPLVVDPVMIASAGESLMQQEAIASYEQCLFPRTSILTPNIDEAMALLGTQESINSPEALKDAAVELLKRYGCAILLKGGHLDGNVCVDVLASPNMGLRSWSHPRIKNVSTHGTGCTLSAALAATLAAGLPLELAVERALHYVEKAIASSYRWESPSAMQALAFIPQAT